VFVGFLISCTVLLAVSWAIILLPNLPWRGRTGWIGIPVKDYLSQGAMFTLCIMGLAEGAVSAWKNGNRRRALTFMILATIFFANILYASTGRTTVLALAVLIPLFCFMRLGWKSAVCLLIAVALFAPVAWSTSQQLRERMIGLLGEVQSFNPDSSLTSTGFRLEFWRKSIVIIEEAPIFGHGTGSTREEFRKLAAGQTGMAGMESANPHNQILATAIQLGLIGVTVLLAMWIARALFFFSPGLPAGVGLAVVVQNIVSSQFNSSLFDATHGWLYVLGVGVASGMILRGRTGEPVCHLAPGSATEPSASK
jgi:O-antigen ligase